MNENRIESIKAGLMQYIGSFLEETDRENAEAAHVALAAFSEVWLECCKKDDGYDLFIAKPLLRAVQIIIKDRLNLIKENIPEDEKLQKAVKQKTADYEKIIGTLQELIDVS